MFQLDRRASSCGQGVSAKHVMVGSRRLPGACVGQDVTKFRDEHFRILSDAIRDQLAWGPDESDVRYNAILDLEDAGLLDAPRLHRAGVLTWRASSHGRALGIHPAAMAAHSQP
jgi:hypothetical protein